MRQFALEHGDEDDSDDSDGNDGVSSSGRAKSGAFAAPFHFPLSFSLSLSLSLVVIIVIALAQDGRLGVGGEGSAGLELMMCGQSFSVCHCDGLRLMTGVHLMGICKAKTQTDRQTHTDTDTHRHTHTHRQTHKDRHT